MERIRMKFLKCWEGKNLEREGIFACGPLERSTRENRFSCAAL